MSFYRRSQNWNQVGQQNASRKDVRLKLFNEELKIRSAYAAVWKDDYYNSELQLKCDDHTYNTGVFHQYGVINKLFELQQNIKKSRKLNEADDEEQRKNSIQMQKLLEISYRKWFQGCDSPRMKLENFKVECCLGKGDYGIVYNATFNPPNEKSQQVALKQACVTMNGEWRGHAIYKERDINIYLGPGKRIHKMTGCFFARMTIESYFVFEVFQGTLNLINHKDLQNVHKGRFIRHLLEGMEWIHEKRIIHNDIRPENLLITNKNNLVISDFGSALLLPEGYDAIKTTSSLGVAGFKDEQATALKLYSKPNDVFAAACSIFEVEIPGEQLVKYKNAPNIPIEEYVMVCRVGKLSDHDAMEVYGATQTHNNSGVFIQTRRSRTSLVDLIQKCRLKKILKKMIDPNHKTRPNASQILNDKEFENFLAELGCTAENLNDHTEAAIKKQHNPEEELPKFETKYISDADLEKAFTVECTALPKIRTLDRAMCGIYYDKKIEEAIHEAEVWKKNLESNFLFEIKEPVRASIKRKNGSTFVEILPKRICETNRMTEKSTFSSKNIHHHDLQAKGPLRDDDQTKDSVCFVPQPKPVQKSVGIPARQLGAKEKYEVSQSVIRAIDAQRGLPEPRFPLNSRQPDEIMPNFKTSDYSKMTQQRRRGLSPAKTLNSSQAETMTANVLRPPQRFDQSMFRSQNTMTIASRGLQQKPIDRSSADVTAPSKSQPFIRPSDSKTTASQSFRRLPLLPAPKASSSLSLSQSKLDKIPRRLIDRKARDLMVKQIISNRSIERRDSASSEDIATDTEDDDNGDDDNDDYDYGSDLNADSDED